MSRFPWGIGPLPDFLRSGAGLLSAEVITEATHVRKRPACLCNRESPDAMPAGGTSGGRLVNLPRWRPPARLLLAASPSGCVAQPGPLPGQPSRTQLRWHPDLVPRKSGPCLAAAPAGDVQGLVAERRELTLVVHVSRCHPARTGARSGPRLAAHSCARCALHVAEQAAQRFTPGRPRRCATELTLGGVLAHVLPAPPETWCDSNPSCEFSRCSPRQARPVWPRVMLA